MSVRWLLCLAIGFFRETKQLNHGRDANPGEFPFVVRIVIYEDFLPGEVSAGILITLSRVLTTCDSVGFFTGQTVNLYDLTSNRVTVMAGSVNSSGDGGQFRNPTRSNVHPYCYLLTSTMTVLFNYGVYEFADPFVSSTMKGSNVPLIAQVKNIFRSMADMERTMKDMTEGSEMIKCFAAGWGNRKKSFEGRGGPDRFERYSSTLQATSMKVLDYPECYEWTCEEYNDCLLSIFEYGWVCAKAEAGGPCIEDNGAPLICAGQVFGIHINPRKCSNRGIPRHFLRLDLVYNYVFDIKDRSNVNSIASHVILGAVFINFMQNFCSVHN